MMVKHISIEVTSKQTKKPVFGGPADLTAYILDLFSKNLMIPYYL